MPHIWRERLRARVGQEFEVACGETVRRGIVASVSDERVEFELGEAVTANSAAPITLLLAVFKFDRMEWAIEKCTELNVTSIVPVIARRTEKHLALAAEKRVERWRRIAREASEQARRVAPPEIGEPMKLAAALEIAADLRIVLAETEREAQLSDVLRARDRCAFTGAGGRAGRRLDCRGSCNRSSRQDGSRRRWARRSCAPKPRRSPRWRSREREID